MPAPGGGRAPRRPSAACTCDARDGETGGVTDTSTSLSKVEADQGRQPRPAGHPRGGARRRLPLVLRRQRGPAQVPRRLPAGRPRRAQRAQAGAARRRPHLHGAGRHPRRRPDRRAVPRPRRPRRRGSATARCGSPPARASSTTSCTRATCAALIGALNDHAGHDAGRLRRRGAQRHAAARPRCPTARRPASRPLADGACADASGPAPPPTTELWLDGERAVTASPPTREDEPLYGADLPAPEVQDRLRLARRQLRRRLQPGHRRRARARATGRWRASRCWSAAGWARATPTDTRTPAWPSPLAFVAPDELVEVVEAVVAVQRDHGNRADRDHARLKYLIDDWGLDRFRAEVEAPPRPAPGPAPSRSCSEAADDHLGWHRQGDGTLVPRRARRRRAHRDTDGRPAARSGLRAVVERFGPGVRLPPARTCCSPASPPATGPRSRRSCATHGVPLAERGRPTSSARPWPAPPCPPAAWPWPRPSGPCPACSTRSHAALDAAGPGRPGRPTCA